ncbi:hypothetical protein HMPREF1982_02096 [Clostridiales bacterium oral taxon 876 str. F0540]|nr:hypothetical protein HMPREF1982_02096 [Clostridiales bacterium oral taxon 876 str. F0540]
MQMIKNDLCIFDKNKKCNDCNECDVCDLNPSKKCDNCGKCLEMEGYDIRAVKIDEVFENDQDMNENEQINNIHEQANEILSYDDEFWDYIDDISELKDLVESGEEMQGKLVEQYPGLLIYKNT